MPGGLRMVPFTAQGRFKYCSKYYCSKGIVILLDTGRSLPRTASGISYVLFIYALISNEGKMDSIFQYDLHCAVSMQVCVVHGMIFRITNFGLTSLEH